MNKSRFLCPTYTIQVESCIENIRLCLYFVAVNEGIPQIWQPYQNLASISWRHSKQYFLFSYHYVTWHVKTWLKILKMYTKYENIIQIYKKTFFFQQGFVFLLTSYTNFTVFSVRIVRLVCIHFIHSLAIGRRMIK